MQQQKERREALFLFCSTTCYCFGAAAFLAFFFLVAAFFGLAAVDFSTFAVGAEALAGAAAGAAAGAEAGVDDAAAWALTMAGVIISNDAPVANATSSFCELINLRILVPQKVKRRVGIGSCSGPMRRYKKHNAQTCGLVYPYCIAKQRTPNAQ